MDQPGCATAGCDVLARGCASGRLDRSGSSGASIRPQLSLRLVKLPLPSVAARAGEVGTELPKPAGVPVRSMAEEEDSPDRE